MKILACLFMFFLLLVSNTVHAAEISGSNDPAFRQAIDAWLNDDDAASLPVFARLAKEGHVAARYMLGQIERTTHYRMESDFYDTLDRKARIALFRAPGGLSGTSWLRVLEEEGEVMAANIRKLSLPNMDAQVVHSLIDSGEKRIVLAELFNLLNRGKYKLLVGLELSGELGPGRKHLSWVSLLYIPNAPNELLQEMNTSLNQDLKNGGLDGVMTFSLADEYLNANGSGIETAKLLGKFLLSPDSVFYKRKVSKTELQKISKWLAQNAPKAEILELPYILCRQECPQSIGQCLTGVVANADGYGGLEYFRSPLESLIPNADYLTSRRAKMSLIRGMEADSREVDLNARFGLSSCLSNVLSK